jgi:hypothetical protein
MGSVFGWRWGGKEGDGFISSASRCWMKLKEALSLARVGEKVRVG